MKAQAHQNQSNFAGLSGLMGGQVGDFFKNDPLALLQSGFSDLAINKDSQIVNFFYAFCRLVELVLLTNFRISEKCSKLFC